MRFIVEPEIFDRFPGLRIAVAAAPGVRNDVGHPEVTRRWQAAWRSAGEEGRAHGNAQSHPRIAPWRVRLRAAGIAPKEFPSSIEAVMRRALKGGEPFVINPLVDSYNTVALRHAVPAGGFDLDEIGEVLELRLTRPGDTFLALGADEPVEVGEGEIAYADGPHVLTRHFVWRQARRGLITPATRSVMLLSEVLGEVGPEVAERVRHDLAAELEEGFGVLPRTFMVDAEHPQARWENADQEQPAGRHIG